MDGSLNRVSLPELGSLEPPLQVCHNQRSTYLGSALFLLGRTAQVEATRGAVHTVRLAHMLFVWSECWLWSGVGLGYVVRHVVNGNLRDSFSLKNSCSHVVWSC